MKIIALQLALLLWIFGLVAAQDKQTMKGQAAASSASSGQEIYKRHCAVCHGNDLKGNGPAPAPFRRETPDLTTLARRHEAFPDAYVSNVLRNGVKIAAHGPAEMPIWGATFREAEGLNESQVAQRIANLISYIKSKQQK
jgi:mono/diheme cytochrome c family protein